MLSFYLFYIKKFFSIINKVFFVITVYLLIFFLFSSFSQKNNFPSTSKTEEDIIKEDINYYKKLINDKDPTKEKYLLKSYQLSLCTLTGQECNNKKTAQENYQNSFSGIIDNLFTSVFFIPPASSIYWAHNSLEKAQLIPKSYAQNQSTPGIGLASLQLVYKLWENMRNFSFVIIVLVLVSIGFMIMFRMKINPQTVISIENALPKIIITLILITFSYPIVGLLIDLVYISLPIIKDLFINVLPNDKINHVFNQFTNSKVAPISIVFDRDNFGMYWNAYVGILGGKIFGLDNLGANYFVAILLNIGIFLIAMRLINPFNEWFLNFIDTTVGIEIFAKLDIRIGKLIVGILTFIVIITIIPLLIVFFGMLFLAFRIFFTLLSSLINLIIYIVIGPIYLLLEAVPGKSSFSSWFKNILGNLIVFPGFLFLIYFSRTIHFNLTTGNIPLILPGFSSGGGAEKLLASLIGLYIYLMIPDFLKVLKQTIIGKESLSIPASPGILFSAGTTVGSTALGFANQLYMLKQGYDFITSNKKGAPGKQNILAETDKNKIPEDVAKSLQILSEFFKK